MLIINICNFYSSLSVAFYEALNGYYHEDFAACLVIKTLVLDAFATPRGIYKVNC